MFLPAEHVFSAGQRENSDMDEEDEEEHRCWGDRVWDSGTSTQKRCGEPGISPQMLGFPHRTVFFFFFRRVPRMIGVDAGDSLLGRLQQKVSSPWAGPLGCSSWRNASAPNETNSISLLFPAKTLDGYS